jgi:hypothetical protein
MREELEESQELDGVQLSPHYQKMHGRQQERGNLIFCLCAFVFFLKLSIICNHCIICMLMFWPLFHVGSVNSMRVGTMSALLPSLPKPWMQWLAGGKAPCQ